MQATDADSNVAEYRMTDNSHFEINNTTGKCSRSSILVCPGRNLIPRTTTTVTVNVHVEFKTLSADPEGCRRDSLKRVIYNTL